MHAVAAQPCALVEAVPGTSRQLHDDERVEDGALRWRAAERQLELHRLAHVDSVERPHPALSAQVVQALGRCRGDDEDGPAAPADLGLKRAPVERIEAGARPPPPDAAQKHRHCRQPGRWRLEDDDRDPGRDRSGQAELVKAPEVREHKTET